MLVFGLTVAFSVNVPMFSTLRFFEGFCLAGITLSLYVLSESLTFFLEPRVNGRLFDREWLCCTLYLAVGSNHLLVHSAHSSTTTPDWI